MIPGHPASTNGEGTGEDQFELLQEAVRECVEALKHEAACVMHLNDMESKNLHNMQLMQDEVEDSSNSNRQ